MAAKKMGRPKIVWSANDFRRFEGLCGIQCTAAEICAVMGVCEETLNRLIKDHYNCTFSESFERFSAAGKASLRRKQFALADRNASMAIWLGKQYLGQQDKMAMETDGELKLNIVVDYGD